MLKKILLTGSGYSTNHFTKLDEAGFESTHIEEDITQDLLIQMLPEFNAYVLGGNERLTDDKLKIAKNLSLISFVGTGYTSFVDEISAQKYNIAIKNTPEVMAPAVAEHTIGLLLGLQRKLFQQNHDVKNSSIHTYHSQELSSLCIGIVGMGAIGSRVARILRTAFGSQVIYTSTNRKPKLDTELNISYVSLDEIFSSSNIIILAIPTNNKTEYSIGETLLAKVKEGVIIINTAGARLIEPIALKKYIDSDQIAAVAMDGYYLEPLPKVADDKFGFLSLPDSRFVITPHTAAKTTQSWSRMVDMAINNVLHFYNA